jgi:transcriptional regulator with GAF, ATPase, and Fis domain
MARRSQIPRPRLIAALRAANGNLTVAARGLAVTREHLTRLVAKLALRDLALNLRVAAGQPQTGRPRTVTKSP